MFALLFNQIKITDMKKDYLKEFIPSLILLLCIIIVGIISNI